MAVCAVVGDARKKESRFNQVKHSLQKTHRLFCVFFFVIHCSLSFVAFYNHNQRKKTDFPWTLCCLEDCSRARAHHYFQYTIYSAITTLMCHIRYIIQMEKSGNRCSFEPYLVFSCLNYKIKLSKQRKRKESTHTHEHTEIYGKVNLRKQCVCLLLFWLCERANDKCFISDCLLVCSVHTHTIGYLKKKNVAKQISIIKLSCCVKFWSDKLFFISGLDSLSIALYINRFFVPLLSSNQTTVKWKSVGEHRIKEWMIKRKTGNETRNTRRGTHNRHQQRKKWKKYSVLLKLRQIKSIYCVRNTHTHSRNKMNVKWIKSTHKEREWCAMTMVMSIKCDQATIVLLKSQKTAKEREREKLTKIPSQLRSI